MSQHETIEQIFKEEFGKVFGEIDIPKTITTDIGNILILVKNVFLKGYEAGQARAVEMMKEKVVEAINENIVEGKK
jgi:hypothetical protein